MQLIHEVQTPSHEAHSRSSDSISILQESISKVKEDKKPNIITGYINLKVNNQDGIEIL